MTKQELNKALEEIKNAETKDEAHKKYQIIQWKLWKEYGKDYIDEEFPEYKKYISKLKPLWEAYADWKKPKGDDK